MTLLLRILLLCAMAWPSLASEQSDIQQLYRRGLQGDEDAVNLCIEKLEGVLAREPQNQLARVYLGSSYTLRSRDLGFGPKKLSALKHGLALMDEAVSAAPNEPKVRLARALTTSALPSFFGRKSESKSDFDLLREVAAQHPEKFDPADLQALREKTTVK